ncbi:MAG: AAA family ATPase [Polyangiaceae bacterium]|nr:AAA family ATPase [Polyangiaceae bacterium]
MTGWQDCPFEDITSSDLPHLYDDDCRWAIKAALGAQRPLLVRGEPGVGKSQLAAAAAHSLRRPLVTQVITSHTEAEELHYHFDAVARLAKAQVLAIERPAGAPAVPPPPIAPNGDLEAEVRADPLHELRFLRPGPLWWVFDWADAEKQYATLSVLKGPRPPAPPEEWGWTAERGTVLLIDELDKAEPDVPNALLEAFGEGAFGVPYRSRRVEAQRATEPPLVVITTNEERELPAAFLRRCLVFELKLEGKEDLATLLVKRGKAHFGTALDDKLYEDVAALLIRERTAQREAAVRPGQAEYLDLLRALVAMHPADPTAQRNALEQISRYTLHKSSEAGF